MRFHVQSQLSSPASRAEASAVNRYFSRFTIYVLAATQNPDIKHLTFTLTEKGISNAPTNLPRELSRLSTDLESWFMPSPDTFELPSDTTDVAEPQARYWWLKSQS